VVISKELVDQIKRQEGYRSHAYRDTEGVQTIGYGLNIDDGISEPLAARILEWILIERRTALASLLRFWPELSASRQDVLLNMAYNLGIPRFLQFRKMLAAAERGNIESVCREMQDSKWYRQVKGRADELIDQYRTG